MAKAEPILCSNGWVNKTSVKRHYAIYRQRLTERGMNTMVQGV